MWDDLKDMLDRENEYDDDQELMEKLYPTHDDFDDEDEDEFDDSDDDDY